MTWDELLAYLKSNRWLAKWTFVRHGESIIARESTEYIITLTRAYNQIHPKIGFQTFASKQHLLYFLVRPEHISARKRKQFIADIIAEVSGLSYAPVNSWRDKYTEVIFHKGDFIKSVELGNKHLYYGNIRVGYERAPSVQLIMPKVNSLDTARATIEDLQKSIDDLRQKVEEYEQKFPFMSQRFELQVCNGKYYAAGICLGIGGKTGFSRLISFERRLAYVSAIKILPLPIAEEILEYLL